MPKSKRLPAFDKYEYYMQSVQDPTAQLGLVKRLFRDAHDGREPRSFGEDFCGTFLLSSCWVHMDPSHRSVAVDLDPEPLHYGLEKHLLQLEGDSAHRLQVYQCDVRNPELPKVDVLCAFNFSYFIFKERAELVEYFRNCRRRLDEKGLFILDCFGGIETAEPNSESTAYEGFRYYWEQASYDPLSHNGVFYIHFKRRGEPKRNRVFRYDWRMWTVPEIRDALAEAGFEAPTIYWEGTNRKGEGNGVFRKVRKTENEAAWVSYLAARPRPSSPK